MAKVIDSDINEMDFALNNFNEQKIYTGALAYAHRIKNLLFLKPGDFPSIPEMGVNIQSYRFKALDIILSGTLKETLSRQISSYVTNVPVENINIDTSYWKGDYFLIVSITLYDKETNITYAIQQSKGEIINFNFKIYDTEKVKVW